MINASAHLILNYMLDTVSESLSKYKRVPQVFESFISILATVQPRAPSHSYILSLHILIQLRGPCLQFLLASFWRHVCKISQPILAHILNPNLTAQHHTIKPELTTHVLRNHRPLALKALRRSLIPGRMFVLVSFV